MADSGEIKQGMMQAAIEAAKVTLVAMTELSEGNRRSITGAGLANMWKTIREKTGRTSQYVDVIAWTINEAMFIRVNDQSLNRNTGKYQLPQIWAKILLNTHDLHLQ